MTQFLLLPRPESFDRAKSLLTLGEKRHNACQNIQSGTNPTNIFHVKFQEKHRICNFTEYQSDYPDVHFLDIIQQVCSLADVKQCLNIECCSIKEKMALAPACEWEHFRDWALVMISCLLNASDQGLNDESWNWGMTVYNLSMVAESTRHEKMLASVDLFEVCELINWMSTVNSYVQPCYEYESPLRTHISKQKFSEANRTAHQMGICKNRLWNLSVGGGQREEVDLPILMRMLQNPMNSSGIEDLHLSSDHGACTAEVCCFSHSDSTRVKQLHKCSGKACGEPLWFPPSRVERQYERITWWLNGNNDNEESPYVVNTKSQPQYMAISHVWSDGTGGGLQGEGRVNRCLFNYFKDIAKELGCAAIWWDTISIPTERAARENAISRMHENFRQASHTVIHDQYLAQFPWTDDGRSCLALLLSPWFTRAWTALELMMSQRRKVWVIYKDPIDRSRHTIKNLDEDVLACHPAYSSRGHWVASSLISQLREQQFNSIGDISKVLRTRTTSWPRDLMVIAGLITGHEPKVNVPGFIARITRDIVLGLVEIEESFLYHGHATMTEKGGFSWCPFSLLDVHGPTNTERADRADKVYVDEHGAVTGAWDYRMLSKEDAERVRPNSFHISVSWQIRTALEQWENCLLLKSRYNNDMQALLVVPLDVGISEICKRNYVVVECQYVGTVYTSLEWGPSYTISVRLGKLTNDADISREEIIGKYDNSKGLRLHGPPCGGHLQSIKQARKQILAMTGTA